MPHPDNDEEVVHSPPAVDLARIILDKVERAQPRPPPTAVLSDDDDDDPPDVRDVGSDVREVDRKSEIRK